MIILEDTIKILKKQLIETVGSEKCLKAQVEMYASKYGEFTNVFEGYVELYGSKVMKMTNIFFLLNLATKLT